MDKNALSNYGWIVAVILVLAIMITMATPFGSVIRSGVESQVTKLQDTAGGALDAAGGASSFDDLSGGSASNTPMQDGDVGSLDSSTVEIKLYSLSSEPVVEVESVTKSADWDGLSGKILVVPRGLQDGYYELAVCAGVDSLKYESVGFITETYNNGTLVDSGCYSTKTAYSSVKDGAGKTWYPNDEQLNADNCNYLFVNIMKIEESDKANFSSDAYVRVTPYAETDGGVKMARYSFDIPITCFE